MASLGRKPKKLCDSFEANEKTFGVCRRCGFSLAEHLAGPEDEVEVEQEEVVAVEPVEEPKQACRNFTWKLDKNGSGVCECGFRKEEHKGEDRSTSMRLPKRLSSIGQRISKRFSETFGKVVLSKPEGKPCETFQINLESEQYGLCKCGFGKLEHEKAAKEKQQELTAKEMMEREKAKKKERGNPREPCKSFKLDLENKEGYGYCKCGFRRDQHMDFTSTPSFANARETLTAPKPFE